MSTLTAVQTEYVPSILLVDDEKNILSALKRVFRGDGYNIYTAENGESALNILENVHIDLIVSDMRMPKMSGAEFLEIARKHFPNTIRILLTGFSDLESTISAINNGCIFKYISKPWEDNDLRLAVKHALKYKQLEQERSELLRLTQKQNAKLKRFNHNLDAIVKERTIEVQQGLQLLESAHQSLKKSYFSLIKNFTGFIAVRDKSLAEHSNRVAEMSRDLAIKMGMSDDDSQQVLVAGLLHDIGKIAMPDHVIHKAFFATSKEERHILVKHPVLSEAILMGMELLQDAASYIRHHHEHWDGGGYPDKLKGEEIPLGARIIAVVNDYDNFKLGMMYSSKHSENDAIDFILKNKWKRYDAKVVDMFLKNKQGKEIKQVSDKIVQLPTNQLKRGYVLARDIINQEGFVLLCKGETLDKYRINKLLHYERTVNEPLDIFIAAKRPIPFKR